MATIIADHKVTDLQAWLTMFKENAPPPELGTWTVLQDTNDPNHIIVLGNQVPVPAFNEFFNSPKMQEVIAKAPMEGPPHVTIFEEVK